MKLRVALSLACVLTGALAYACSSDDEAPGTVSFAGSCRQLASRCHPVQTALGVECHELGHAGDDTACGPRSAECLAECPETDASLPLDGHGEDGGHTPEGDAGGADADAGVAEACAAYCTCMGATCSAEPNYPFANEAACLEVCGRFTEAERTCFASHCEAAKTGANTSHDCEHATGRVACH